MCRQRQHRHLMCVVRDCKVCSVVLNTRTSVEGTIEKAHTRSEEGNATGLMMSNSPTNGNIIDS